MGGVLKDLVALAAVAIFVAFIGAGGLAAAGPERTVVAEAAR